MQSSTASRDRIAAYNFFFCFCHGLEDFCGRKCSYIIKLYKFCCVRSFGASCMVVSQCTRVVVVDTHDFKPSSK